MSAVPSLRRALVRSSFALLALPLVASCDEDGGGLGRASYAIQSLVFTPEGTTTYVNLVDSLDAEEQLAITGALEFGGSATIGSYDGDLFVGEGETPVIHRYARDAQDEFQDVGSVSFANYEFAPSEIGTFLSRTKVYTNGGSSPHAIWDPEAMATLGSLDTTLVDRVNFRLRSSNRTAVRGDRFYRTFFYQQIDGAIAFSDDTQLLAVDTTTDTVVNVDVETRCPVLNKITEDEDGNVYFSTWLYAAANFHLQAGPSTCALRKKAGEDTFDDAWQLDFTELTEGRQAAELSYIGDGKAILSVFHHERVELPGEYTVWNLAFTPNWRVWFVDLEARTAHPIEAIDFSAGDHVTATIDGRFMLFAPNAEYTSTVVYEIHRDGTAERLFEAQG